MMFLAVWLLAGYLLVLGLSLTGNSLRDLKPALGRRVALVACLIIAYPAYVLIVLGAMTSDLLGCGSWRTVKAVLLEAVGALGPDLVYDVKEAWNG